MLKATEVVLKETAKVHKKVYEIIQSEYVDSEDKLRERLGNILQEIGPVEQGKAS